MLEDGDELELVNPWEPGMKKGDSATLLCTRVKGMTGNVKWTSGSYKGQEMYVGLVGYFEKSAGPW